MTGKLEIPQAARLSIAIREISNGFVVTRDGLSTFYATYGEAISSLPPTTATKRKTK